MMTKTTKLPIDSNELREGDILFIAIDSFLYRRVAAGTGSKTSHVGLLLRDNEGQWVVAESCVPRSKYTPLADFLSRSKDDWLCIKRLPQALSDSDIEAIKTQCQQRMGILYHFGFKYHSPRLFCSKFVYDVFEQALGIQVGKLQTLRELLQEQPETPLTFWRLWYFGFIPWSRITITPAAQMNSEGLLTVYCSDTKESAKDY